MARFGLAVVAAVLAPAKVVAAGLAPIPEVAAFPMVLPAHLRLAALAVEGPFQLELVADQD
jgi:hypothetical protein